MKRLRIFAGICVVFLAACGGGKDGVNSCGDSVVKQEHLITNYTSTLMRYEKPIDASSVELPKVLAANESPAWNMFSIDLKASYQTYSGQVKPRVQLSLFAQAYACSLVPPSGKQRLTKISITSANDFSAAYPAGSELLPLFASIDNSTALSILLLNQPAPLALKLKLLQAPQFARQNFQIQIGLDDGSSYQLKTGDVYFALP